MLDTNIVSLALRGHEHVVQHLVAVSPQNLCMSAVTLAELRYGADKRNSALLHALIDKVITAIRVAPFDADAALSYGSVADALRSAGTPIGIFDTLIAAHSLAIGATVVTNNVKHFAKVRHLEVVDWSSP